ncbi:MAG: oxidoreductase, partial [Alistipes sp.]|nr:oxidoreductase [Alistipes sp.]
MENAVVIGASSGIGRQAARLLARSGRYARIGITARREGMLRDVAAISPEKFAVGAFDLAGPGGPSLLARFIEELGDVSLVLLCSATGHIN